jgi:hypothetical protein
VMGTPDVVIAHGSVLVDDPDRIGPCPPWGRTRPSSAGGDTGGARSSAPPSSTTARDHQAQLLDQVPGRSATGPSQCLGNRLD